MEVSDGRRRTSRAENLSPTGCTTLLCYILLVENGLSQICTMGALKLTDPQHTRARARTHTHTHTHTHTQQFEASNFDSSIFAEVCLQVQSPQWAK
jgi:hypothetical protein